MTTDEKVKILIGEMTIQVLALRTENEQLRAQLAEKDKKEEKPE